MGYNPQSSESSQIVGVFVIIDARTKMPKDEALYKRATEFASRRKLPVIMVDEQV